MEATTDPETGQPVYLVWTRDVTPDSMGWLKWAIAVVVAFCAFGAFAAYMAEDPGQIPFFVFAAALICFLIWLVPTLANKTKRRNPAIHTIGRDLAWAKKRVPIDQVDRFRVAEEVNSHYNAQSGSSYKSRVTVCDFQMYDGSKVRFAFADLPEHERATLTAALDAVLPQRRESSLP